MNRLLLLGCRHPHTLDYCKILSSRDSFRADLHPLGLILDSPYVESHSRNSKIKLLANDPANFKIYDGYVLADATINNSKLLRQVARYDKPVFIEKPFGINRRDALALAELLGGQRAPIGFGYRLRRHPAGEKIIGLDQTWNRVNLRFRVPGLTEGWAAPEQCWIYDPKQSGGNLFTDLASHLVHLALALRGDALQYLVAAKMRIAKGEVVGGLAEFSTSSQTVVIDAGYDGDQIERCFELENEDLRVVAEESNDLARSGAVKRRFRVFRHGKVVEDTQELVWDPLSQSPFVTWLDQITTPSSSDAQTEVQDALRVSEICASIEAASSMH